MRIITAKLALALILALQLAPASFAQVINPAEIESDPEIEQAAENLELNPTTERYVLYELRDLRRDIEKTKLEVLEEVVDRQMVAIDKALSYSAGVVNFFWFFLSFVTGVVALVGWKSFRDVKNTARDLVHEEVKNTLKKSQEQFKKLELDLKHKEEEIIKNQEELAKLQRISKLWIQVNRERDDRQRLNFLDELLELEPDSTEALVMKAGSYARLHIAEAAIETATKALEINPNQSMALYHRAHAHVLLKNVEDAISDLNYALKLAPVIRQNLEAEKDFDDIRDLPEYQGLLEE
jgi:tetratricopeptide (TPR) repeat protein